MPQKILATLTSDSHFMLHISAKRLLLQATVS